MKFNTDQRLMSRALTLGLATGLMACSSAYPPRDTSALDAINAQMKQAAAPKAQAAAVPDAVSSSLLPPVKSAPVRTSRAQLEQRFDLVVTDAPISQVLMGIVHNTRYSIMLKPKTPVPSTQGAAAAAGAVAAAPVSASMPERLTVNLKNVTMFEALDSIRDVYGYDYTMEGNRIYVQPPELQTRLYQVNYIIGQRRGVSDLQVIGGASVGSSSGSSGSSSSSSSSSSSGTSGSFSSVQASGLSTMAKSDIWSEVEDALRTTLGCQIPRNTPSRAGGSGSGAAGGGSSSSSGSSGTASRADVSFQGDAQSGERPRGVDGCTDGRAMSISQMSGTILVRGMPSEHRIVEKMLKALQLNVERQVIIEAKIIDVQLNSGSQQGINWSDFSKGLHRASMGANTSTLYEMQGGTLTTSPGGRVASSISSANAVTPATLGTALGTALLGTTPATAFASGMGIALQLRNFSAMINFLQTQGEVHVLSSPRIATLNSQKAVIKVGTEEPYVSSITPGTSAVAAGSASSVATAAALNYQPFFSGISLDVTPKIDDKDNITLHVHAMVNSIAEKSKIAAPTADSVSVPFAVNTISETDSVVRAKDGQVIVIGGLMTENMVDSRNKTPGAGDVPGLGAFFSKGAQTRVKRELVILLRPTVVKDDSVWSENISATQGRIESIGAAGAPPEVKPPASQ